jgi:hypothetical protein
MTEDTDNFDKSKYFLEKILQHWIKYQKNSLFITKQIQDKQLVNSKKEERKLLFGKFNELLRESNSISSTTLDRVNELKNKSPKEQETGFEKLSKELDEREKALHEKLDSIHSALNPSFKDRIISQAWGIAVGGIGVGILTTIILGLIGIK